MIYEKLKTKVIKWRKKGYPCKYPEISEIFVYIKEKGYLRKAQVEALEYYWYVRAVLKTPKIKELYKNFYKSAELLEALGIPYDKKEVAEVLIDGGLEGVFQKIETDDELVKKYKLEGLRESLTLSYPSYILALAMGAGKTILIAGIIATEFALSLEYPEDNFVKNALVFAPGKTILGALKEISFAPYEKILPPRLYKKFIVNVKFVYTRDGQKDIPVIKGSCYNVIITNTEKIRLTKESIRKSCFQSLFKGVRNEEELKNLIANQRLYTITSLPNLAVFSDEAHHTYGQKVGEELKRVRQTINYIAEKTSLIVSINTTGTPYYRGKVLRDVIYWYGLSRGIKDGILKDVRGNIVAYRNVSDENFIKEVVEDFIENYWNVSIYNGAKAKLAIYFPRIEDIGRFKGVVERVLLDRGIDPAQTILEVHNKAPKEVQELFDNRINEPSQPWRIFLLVNKGTEGWNCPSLFACALARELKGANNFCLQAATRCLRQVPFNTHKAKIYLSEKNVPLLDAQLRETYGESLSDLNLQTRETYEVKLVVRKTEIPPVVIKTRVKRIVFKGNQKPKSLILSIKELKPEPVKIKKTIYDLTFEEKAAKVLKSIDEKELELEEPVIDVYSLAVDIAENYRLNSLEVLSLLKKHFREGVVTLSIAEKIKEQVEEQISEYEVREEVVEQALALLKLEGFKKDKNGNFYTEIRVNKTRLEELLLYWKEAGEPAFGFHYDPYNFDSKPEKEFFESLLHLLNEDPDEVEDIYFTGAMTSKDKTDFIFEYYSDADGRWHAYTPDFLIRKKNGKIIIVEIKGEPFKKEAVEKAMREIEGLNPDKVKYEILETEKDTLKFGEFEKLKELIYRG
jgi:hypothetical protein